MRVLVALCLCEVGVRDFVLVSVVVSMFSYMYLFWNKALRLCEVGVRDFVISMFSYMTCVCFGTRHCVVNCWVNFVVNCIVSGALAVCCSLR
jgi:hypothetical protein